MSTLTDMLYVRSSKPLGHINVHELAGYGLDVNSFEEELHRRGLKTLIIQDTHDSPRLYTYHEPSLRVLLKRGRQILEDAGWTSKPEEFVRRIAEYTVFPPSKLSDLIMDCYADYDNGIKTNRFRNTVIDI